jgi:hypothetical protein
MIHDNTNNNDGNDGGGGGGAGGNDGGVGGGAGGDDGAGGAAPHRPYYILGMTYRALFWAFAATIVLFEMGNLTVDVFRNAQRVSNIIVRTGRHPNVIDPQRISEVLGSLGMCLGGGQPGPLDRHRNL